MPNKRKNVAKEPESTTGAATTRTGKRSKAENERKKMHVERGTVDEDFQKESETTLFSGGATRVTAFMDREPAHVSHVFEDDDLAQNTTSEEDEHAPGSRTYAKEEGRALVQEAESKTQEPLAEEEDAEVVEHERKTAARKPAPGSRKGPSSKKRATAKRPVASPDVSTTTQAQQQESELSQDAESDAVRFPSLSSEQLKRARHYFRHIYVNERWCNKCGKNQRPEGRNSECVVCGKKTNPCCPFCDSAGEQQKSKCTSGLSSHFRDFHGEDAVLFYENVGKGLIRESKSEARKRARENQGETVAVAAKSTPTQKPSSRSRKKRARETAAPSAHKTHSAANDTSTTHTPTGSAERGSCIVPNDVPLSSPLAGEAGKTANTIATSDEANDTTESAANDTPRDAAGGVPGGAVGSVSNAQVPVDFDNSVNRKQNTPSRTRKRASETPRSSKSKRRTLTPRTSQSHDHGYVDEDTPERPERRREEEQAGTAELEDAEGEDREDGEEAAPFYESGGNTDSDYESRAFHIRSFSKQLKRETFKRLLAEAVHEETMNCARQEKANENLKRSALFLCGNKCFLSGSPEFSVIEVVCLPLSPPADAPLLDLGSFPVASDPKCCLPMRSDLAFYFRQGLLWFELEAFSTNPSNCLLVTRLSGELERDRFYQNLKGKRIVLAELPSPAKELLLTHVLANCSRWQPAMQIAHHHPLAIQPTPHSTPSFAPHLALPASTQAVHHLAGSQGPLPLALQPASAAPQRPAQTQPQQPTGPRAPQANASPQDKQQNVADHATGSAADCALSDFPTTPHETNENVSSRNTSRPTVNCALPMFSAAHNEANENSSNRNVASQSDYAGDSLPCFPNLHDAL